MAEIMTEKRLVDEKSLKALQQIVATAVKHLATNVIITKTDQAASNNCTACFQFDNGSSKNYVTVDVTFDALSALVQKQAKSKLNSSAIFPVFLKTLKVNCEVIIAAEMLQFKRFVIDSNPPVADSELKINVPDNFLDTEIENYSEARGAVGLSPLPEIDDTRPISTADFSLRKINPMRAKIESEPHKTEQEKTSTHKSVLVIDDDGDQRAILTRVLELAGYMVESAADGIDGMLSAVRYLPDLVLVDYMMPELDGFETIRRIRQTKETTSIPIIVLTAYPDSEVEFKLLDAGANDFCSKSISKKVLLKRMEKLLEG
jgi:CheY-like chemotaxis protein